MLRRLLTEWKRLLPYLQLVDFAALPKTKVGFYVRAAVYVFAAWALWRRLDSTAAPLLEARAPTPIPAEEIEDYRFRLPERTRREIFAQIAEAELAERKRAIEKNTWDGHLWSREDDRGHYERVELRGIAQKYRISLTQAYLVLDEGIRAHWPAPDGNPLPGTTPPLNPRSGW